MSSRWLGLIIRGAAALAIVAASALDAAAEARSQTPSPSQTKAKRLNVLLIMADDLRPEMGCYGSPALTPNLDRLAKRGVQFQRAYCQQAVCNPSRSSMLTGLRPDTLGLWNNGTHFRELKPNVITLPEWFKAHGYVTRDVGKIFHNWLTKAKGDRQSWSAPEYLFFANHGEDKAQISDLNAVPNLAKTPRCEKRDVPDEAYFDGRIAAEAVKVLNEIKDQPFFLGVGFWKPHAPFNAPKRYWDLYRPDQLPKLNSARPRNAVEAAFHDNRELLGAPPNQRRLTPDQIQEMRHGYFANVSYLDAQVGKVLDAVDKQGLAESTVIVFCGDHGYQLGEHELWAKTSCFELDARVPLLIAEPQVKHPGSRAEALTELLDIFPTLIDLCGLPAPSPQVLQGVSLKPVLDDPKAVVKAAAFTQHPRPAYYDRTPESVPDSMGYSVRTDRARYTEWREWTTGRILGRELYDHESDPEELNNIATSPSDPQALAEAEELLKRMFPPRKPKP